MKKRKVFSFILIFAMVLILIPQITKSGMAYSDAYSTVSASSDILASGYTVAVKADGSLWAWGENDIGNLGDGTTRFRSSPVKIMDDVVSVSAGGNHCLAIKKDGSLWVWGGNYTCQLGDGTMEDSYFPKKIMDGVVAASAGGHHNMAIKADGSLWGLGSNGSGQIGNGSYSQYISAPVKITDNVVMVSAGENHSMAIKTDGSLWVWGNNYYGQLGDGSGADSSLPKKIMSGISDASAGNCHSMAVGSDGSLWTWGANFRGEIGDGTTTSRLSPIKVMNDVAVVSAGDYYYSMVITTDGRLLAWGNNQRGQLGDGTLLDRLMPVQILDNVDAISAGGRHSVAVKKDGTLWAWGFNDDLRYGTYTSKTPVFVMGDIMQTGNMLGVSQISTADSHTIVEYNKPTIIPSDSRSYISNRYIHSDYWVTLDADQANKLISDANYGKIEESFAFIYCNSESDCGINTAAIPEFYDYIHASKTKIYVLDMGTSDGYIKLSGFQGWLEDGYSTNSFWTPIVLGYNAETRQRFGVAGGTHLRDFVEVLYKSGIPIPGLDDNKFWLSSDGKTINAYFGSLAHVNIPYGVTTIGEAAFYCNTGLKSVSIPNTVSIIEKSAFFMCDLLYVNIPESVIYIDDWAFSTNLNLSEVCFYGSVPRFDWSRGAFTWINASLTFYVPEDNISWDGFSFQYHGWNEETENYPLTDVTIKRGLPNSYRHASLWAIDSLTDADALGIVPNSFQCGFGVPTTRADFCTLAVALYEKLTGCEIVERMSFNDTTDINVEKMAGIGVVTGVGNNNFAPNDTLTREQAATMLSRLAIAFSKPLPQQVSTFNDNSIISSWAINAVGQIQAASIMGGVGNNTFAPKDPYTREQSIITMLRLYKILV